MPALQLLSPKQDAPGPSRAYPRKHPSQRPYLPRRPRQARLPTWWLAVSEAAAPHPLRLSCYIARSAMFLVLPSARGATTMGSVGVKRAGAGRKGGGGGKAKAFYSPPKPSPATEHAQLPGVAPRTFRECTQLFRVFVAAGGRLAVAAAGGGGGEVSGEGRGSVYTSQSPSWRKPSFAHPIILILYPPQWGQLLHAPSPHAPALQKFCAGLVQG